MKELYACPCCGEKTINVRDDFEICKICFWEDDPGQSAHPDDDDGANSICLNRYREGWKASRLNA